MGYWFYRFLYSFCIILVWYSCNFWAQDADSEIVQRFELLDYVEGVRPEFSHLDDRYA